MHLFRYTSSDELIVTGEVPAEFTLKDKGKDGDDGGASGSKRPKDEDEDEDAYPDFYAKAGIYGRHSYVYGNLTDGT